MARFVGVLPYLVGLATGNVWVTLFGVVFTWSMLAATR
jgi:hypothetical protein